MSKLSWCTWCALVVLSVFQAVRAEEAKWTPAGWGGGGFYYAAAFHPSRDGVIYLGGDVNGAYRSDDNGKTWKSINRGIAGYGVFTIAVDPSNPDTVYAATDEGLSKSTDQGETWKTIPQSSKKELRLTGEKGKSTHNVAVDPTNSNIVFVGTPNGKIYKSTDGAQTWTKVWERATAQESTPSLFTQMGRVNDSIFGGFWMPVKFPEGVAQPSGIGFSLKTEGRPARDIFFTLATTSGARYRSKNLHDRFEASDWRDVILKADDFELDPEFKSKNAEKAAAAPATPDWSTVNRFDLAGVAIDRDGQVLRLGKLFFVGTTDGKDAKTDAIDFSAAKNVQTYGNFRVGQPADGPVFSVAVSPKQPNTVAAATNDDGVLLSKDGGQTWKTVGPMKRAAAVAFTPADPNVIYAACRAEQLWKTVDGGANWTKVSTGLPATIEARDVVVSAENANHVFAIGSENWNGRFFASTDGGASWTMIDKITPDPIGNPTLPEEAGKGKDVGLSNPPNLAINPRNPKQLYIAANWRSVISNDGGATWQESMKGADISCVGDIRFYKGKVYTASMDEGVMVSSDNGQSWKQYWPLRHNNDLSGHYWRLDIRDVNGATRIISASSPWDRKYNQVVISEDDGATFKAYRQGLPDYLPTANTMWGRGYARALAVDPKDPNIVYLGIDGDASPGQSGGGLFKSTDGGKTWRQPANQPGSRRMFFGLAIDPTDTKRLYWGACADKGGLYRSEDGGESWEKVFSQDQWIFNTHVTADGTVFALGKLIYRSTDHGKTWQPLAKLPVANATVVGFETHPTDPNTMWAVCNFWGGNAQDGGVYKTTDGGKTWTDITGDLPNRRPLIIRYNPETSELWAGFVGLYRLKQ
jgi:photosystem II stability/assembly factor-like uncharacterized protein